MRIYPAYGRTIAAHLVRGNRPAAIGVLLSTRWGYFDHVAKLCLQPEDWALGRYEFGFLHNEHVVAIVGEGASEAQFGELLIDLMIVGPRLLWARDLERWLYQGAEPDELRIYADGLTKRARHGVALWARDSYEDAQLRELGLLQRETARAAELGREAVSFIKARSAARLQAEQLFASAYQAVDDRAA